MAARTKGLKTLIRLQKQKVDELRKRIGALENRRAQLIAETERLAAELERELKLSTQVAEMGAFFGDFAQRIRNRRHELELNIKDVERQMDALAAEVRAAYAEQKKFELVKTRREKEEAVKEERKTTVALDEAAANKRRREKVD